MAPLYCVNEFCWLAHCVSANNVDKILDETRRSRMPRNLKSGIVSLPFLCFERKGLNCCYITQGLCRLFQIRISTVPYGYASDRQYKFVVGICWVVYDSQAMLGSFFSHHDLIEAFAMLYI